MDREIECDICGKKFKTFSPNKKRCSPKCVLKYRSRWERIRRGNIPAKVRDRKCVVCGNGFIDEGAVNHKTCSLKCRKELSRRRIRGYNKRYHNYQLEWGRSDKRKTWMKQYREKNRERLNRSDRESRRMNPEKRIVAVLRATLNRRIKLKNRGRLSCYVDYTVSQLKNHIEKQFRVGMNWGNYGRTGWHIDHKKPLSAFVFFDKDGKENREEVRRAMALENLQPLWATENLKKGCRQGGIQCQVQ